MRLRHIILFLLMAVFITPVRAGHKDHLGNNREVVNVGGTVKQVTNYYPFGAPYADPAAVMSASLQPYKYNGKELDLMHGLNTYDYGARQYYSIVGRWDRIDPLCEKYYSVSPYAYCKNSPINAIDPDGRAVNFLGGVLLGGAEEYFSQVAGNIATDGFTFRDFTNIDVGDVAIAAAVGGATSGVSALGAIGKGMIKIGGELLKAYFDMKTENGKITTTVNNANETKNNLIGSTVGKATGKVIGKGVSKVPSIPVKATNISNRRISKLIQKETSVSAKQAQGIAKKIRPSVNKFTRRAKSTIDKVKSSQNQIEAGVSGATEEKVKKNI